MIGFYWQYNLVLIWHFTKFQFSDSDTKSTFKSYFNMSVTFLCLGTCRVVDFICFLYRFVPITFLYVCISEYVYVLVKRFQRKTSCLLNIRGLIGLCPFRCVLFNICILFYAQNSTPIIFCECAFGFRFCVLFSHTFCFGQETQKHTHTHTHRKKLCNVNNKT